MTLAWRGLRMKPHTLNQLANPTAFLEQAEPR